MRMTRRLVPLSCGVSLAIVLVTRAAFAQHVVDEALASAYAELKADPDIQDEGARHRKLMEMADQYSQFAEAAFQATADLQDYAAKVRATGLVFRTPLGKVKQFDKGLKQITEHPAFKSFQKYATIKGHASTVLGLGDRLATTLKNPDLPPSARNSLMLLQVVGTGLEQLGEIPLAGPALEGYGKILSGLTDVMNDLAGKAAITTKEGVFSRTEEQERLQGLDPKAQYVKTPLWHRGIPLVQEYPFATGQDRYYLQMPNGTWVGIPDYDAVASVAADYYLTKKKNPDAQTLWKYYNDPEEREKLAFWAAVELENRRIDEVLADLPGVDRSTRYTQFTETEERIKRWHKGLGLPLEYDALNRLIRIEVANPGGVARALRTRVLRAYPGFAEYLASAGVDPQTLEMEAMLERFEKYRSGEHLGGPRVTLGPHLMASLPADIPSGWQQLVAPNREPDPKLTGVPQQNSNPGSTVQWWQWFSITKEQGIEWNGHMFFIPSQKRSPEFVSVAIGLEPQFYAWTAEGKTYSGDKREQLEGMVTNTAIDCRWIDDAKSRVLYVADDSHVEIHLVCAGVYAMVRAHFAKSPRSPYTKEDCLTLARHFADVVIQKIDSRQK